MVCSTFTRRGQARYPEGGRRREDEPLGEGWRVRANAGDDEPQGDEHLENRHAGARAPDPVYGSGRPAFSPLPSYADAAGSSLHQRGEPRTPSLVL